MKWLESKIINKSEVARELGISPILFRMKLKRINRNRFTPDEHFKLVDIWLRLVSNSV